MKRICNKPDLILDRQTGKLCQQFRTFLFDLLSPEYIPSDFTTGYYVDWKLLGKYHNCFNNKTYLGDKPKFACYKQRPKDLSFEEWVKYDREITKWTRWLTKSVFDPREMLLNKVETDRVNLRIAVSQLNKWELPKDFKDYIFDNIITQYYTRKRVFDIYYYSIILEIPFY